MDSIYIEYRNTNNELLIKIPFIQNITHYYYTLLYSNTGFNIKGMFETSTILPTLSFDCKDSTLFFFKIKYLVNKITKSRF